MKLEAVRELVLGAIPDAEIRVEGEGCNFTITVVSEIFRNKKPIERQMIVMEPFKPLLATGEVHALGVKAFTPNEV